MLFTYSERVQTMQRLLQRFMDEHIYPKEQRYRDGLKQAADPWNTVPLMEELKIKAREANLWNLFLPESEFGMGLSNLEYAPLAEIMGRVLWAPEVFNCNAPDTGNMEVLVKYGNPEQQQRWLRPLLDGKIRSAFAMTEPAVASSDATNVETRIERDGDNYLINGHKWFITGAMNKRCKIMIVMGKTDPGNPNRHLQQSQILVPMDAPGVEVVRPLSTYGYEDPPLGHAEVKLNNVRVPRENLLLDEGRGFEIAQGRLGPGRIHHCMRLIGAAQRALELMCHRAEQRVAFGRKLSAQGVVREHLAWSSCEIEQARLLTLKAADKIDRLGAKEARDLIAQIKVVVPNMACKVLDRAIQLHGAGGFTEDYFMAEAFSYARWCRMADGPDQVHLAALGKQVLKAYAL